MIYISKKSKMTFYPKSTRVTPSHMHTRSLRVSYEDLEGNKQLKTHQSHENTKLGQTLGINYIELKASKQS